MKGRDDNITNIIITIIIRGYHPQAPPCLLYPSPNLTWPIWIPNDDDAHDDDGGGGDDDDDGGSGDGGE